MRTDSLSKQHKRDSVAALRQPRATLPGKAAGWESCAKGAAVAILLTAAVFIAHVKALQAGALCFDDSEYLTDNVLVRNPSLHSAGQFLGEVLEPSTVHGYYQPLTMISLMVDYALGGRPDHLFAFHLTSLLLHLANTLLIALLLYRLFGNATVAVVLAMLFGVHPMAVESIAWVGERKTVLATFFVLLSIVSYIRYCRRGSWPAYVASLTCFALGLLAKPTVTPLPACLLVLDLWPLNRLSLRSLAEKVPCFAIAALSAFITYESQRRTAVTIVPAQHDLSRLFYVVCHNIVCYPWHMLWPVHLSSNYGFPANMSVSNPRIAAGVIGTAVLLASLAVSLRWTRALVSGWLFFFIAIFPTLGVIGFTNVIAADKYAYWPVLGLLIGLAGVLKHVRRVAVVAGAAVAVVGLTIGTHIYIGKWATTESLMRYMVSMDDGAAAPLIHLGLELERQGRSAEAIPFLQRATVSAPQYEGGFYNLGISLANAGHPREAIAAYGQAIALKPDFVGAYNNLGTVLLSQGATAEAKAAYLRAVQLQPTQADAQYNLANVLYREGDFDGAVQHYRQAIAAQPNHAAAHLNLATVLWEQGQLDVAVAEYEQALKCRPDYAAVAVRLAEVYATSERAELRRPQRAVELAEHAVKVTAGQDLSAWTALASSYGQAGESARAAVAARHAMQLAETAGNPGVIEEVRKRVGAYLSGGASQNGAVP